MFGVMVRTRVMVRVNTTQNLTLKSTLPNKIVLSGCMWHLVIFNSRCGVIVVITASRQQLRKHL